MYHAGAGKELLAFGQAILVGEHNVRVERHLSQGGFAHVYLVRSDKPVGGTTQHVLKHIRVANEGMLNEVRKEVDIMRLLRGHPNIVHLIDAAWSKTPTGPSAYEVFILMEFCPGGGIIDMMNRRLRERLTEQEILQIFVDVCEALAFMHNLRPALLHRDLKVENILQSSATKYKLCDFGSATPVAQRPPSTLQEIQALGADLDRHTTLQYRAPEMIDPNLRRPIDEKSDVWALGVLLYKLCYYTTPFEEHGPLAILNVQYTTPPYPVYSVQMNQLIGSMLQEYGAHRPSVFDLLDRVHAMRGTRSPYTYNRTPVAAIPAAPPKSSLDGILVRNQAAAASSSAGAGAAAARKQVLDAIAPMRRGRPEVQSQEDRAWEAVKAKDKADESAWDLAALNVKRVEAKSPAVVSPSAGFGDSFKPSIRNAHAPSSVASPPLPPSVYGSISPPPPATSTTPQPRPGTLSTPSYYPSALRAPSAPLQDTRKAAPVVSGRPADVELSAEERFPSLEALDRAFSPPVASPPGSNLGAPMFGRDQGPGLAPTPPLRGARSQQVTGVAMKDASPPTLPPKPAMLPTGHAAFAVSSSNVGARPSLRRHRSSVAIKSPVLASSSSAILQPKPPRKEREQATDWLTGEQHESTHRREESRPGRLPQQDWLTGDFDEPQAPPAHVARSSLNGPRQMGPRPLPASPAKPARRSPSPKPPLPPRPATRADSPEPIKEETQSSFARASVFREETRSAFRHTGAQNGDSYLGARPLPSQPLQASPSAPAPVKTSPRETGLTDNWSPVEDRHPASHQQQQQQHGNSSSSDEEKGPEDVTPSRRSVLEPKQRKSKIRPKGRNSSVHDLVDLWSTDSGPAPAKTGDRLERPPSRQTGVGAGPKRSPGPSPVLRPAPAPQPPSPAKARPQSLFLYGSGGSTLSPPSQQPANAFTALAHQTPSSSASSPQNLAAPPQDASRARASRRGSISDMVEKYEALVTPRSPATPRWSPGGGGAGQIALPGLAAPSAAPVGRTSPGLSVQQRRVSTGRISPAGSAISVSTNTSTTSAFHGRQQPARKNTAPPASPSKAPPSPTKAAFNFASGYTGGAARTATPVMNPGTPKPAASHTPKPSGSSTPRPMTNFTGAKTTATGTAPGAGAGVRNILTGTARTTTTGSAGVKPVTTGSTSVKPVTTGNIAGINLKPITTGMSGVKTTTTGALRTPTSATASFAPGHGRQSSTSVLFGKPSTPVPSSPVTLVSPIPLKPSSLSRRPGPSLKSITPPREANGAPAQPIASPTPDRPYTGVSKLIDQWQRKTEEAGAGAPRTGSYKSKG